MQGEWKFLPSPHPTLHPPLPYAALPPFYDQLSREEYHDTFENEFNFFFVFSLRHICSNVLWTFSGLFVRIALA